jgi:signal transduction histidine kinase
MTIESKFIRNFIFIDIVVAAIMVIGAGYIITSRSAKIEDTYATRNMNRLEKVLSNELSYLSKTTKDYAYWNDTYAFIENENKAYITSNVNQMNLGDTLNLDFVYYLNLRGDVITYWENNLLAQTASSSSRISTNDVLAKMVDVSKKHMDGIDGYVTLPEGVAMVSIKPTIPSNRNKASNGLLIMGQYLNQEKIQRIADAVQMPVLFDVSITPSTTRFYFKKTNSEVYGYYPIKDVFNLPCGQLEMTFERDIYTESKLILYTFNAFAVIIFTILALIVILFSKTVFSDILHRISYLSTITSNAVQNKFQEPTYRPLWSKYPDELGRLAESVERMRQAAFTATHELQRIVDEKTKELERKLAKEEKNSEAMIWLLDREKQHTKEYEEKEKELQDVAKDLYKANLDLDEANKIKNEFVNIATHQLKNPLAALGGFIRLIQQGMYGKIPKKFEEPLSQIFVCTDQVIALVEDMLKISRSEQTDQVLHMESINLTTLMLTEIRPVLEPLAKQKGLVCDYKTTKVAPIVVADKSKLKDVLGNLIQNAIKYSNKGYVRVRHEVKDTEVITSVSDTGIGISSDEIKNMFKRFYRTKEVISKGIPGTGLGLYIVKEYVEKMGGKVWVESTYGKGSTFTFSLPRAM